MSANFPQEMPKKRRKPVPVDEPAKKLIPLPDDLLPADPVPELYNHQFMNIAGRPQKLGPSEMARFCDELAKHGNRSRAARDVGVSTATIKGYENSNKVFSDAVQMAIESFAGDVEAELIRRAMEGITDYKLDNKGNVVLEIKKYSDRLLELLTKRHHAEYGERNTLDVNVKGGLLVLNAETENPDEWKNRHNENEKPAPTTIDVESSEA